MFHCYNIITTYSVVVLANKGVADSCQITTSKDKLPPLPLAPRERWREARGH